MCSLTEIQAWCLLFMRSVTLFGTSIMSKDHHSRKSGLPFDDLRVEVKAAKPLPVYGTSRSA